MAKDVRQALAELVARKDAAVFQDAERFTRAMESATGGPSAEITALAAGLTARLPWTLRKVGDATALGNLAADLQHTKGMTLAQAWWTIDTWAHALVISLPPRAAAPPPVPPSSPGAVNPAPSSPRPGLARPSPSPAAAPPPPPLPSRPAGPAAVAPAPVSPPAPGGASPRPEGPTPGMPSSSAPAPRMAVPPPTTPMGIEFLSGADGLVRVTRVWSDPSLVRAPSGLALAEAVKTEEAGARSLSGTSVVPADHQPARKKAAARSPTGPAGVPRPPADPPPTPPVHTADYGRPTGRVAKGKAAPSAPFFHFDPAGKASGAAPVPRAAPTPPARPPVDKHLGPTPVPPPVPVPTPASAEDQYQLARDLLEGRGRPANLPEGIRLLRLAAAQDHVPAFYTLGMVCLRGFGMTEDPAEAATWFRKSAEKGNADAMVQLGTLYQCGHGIPADLLEARRWFVAASQKGHPEAAALLKTLPL